MPASPGSTLGWIDRDGDGFVEYQGQTPAGPMHPGWKDSDDALAHAGGTPATGPIALCEVQAYVYAARLAGAALARALAMPGRAEKLEPVRRRHDRRPPAGAARR